MCQCQAGADGLQMLFIIHIRCTGSELVTPFVMVNSAAMRILLALLFVTLGGPVQCRRQVIELGEADVRALLEDRQVGRFI